MTLTALAIVALGNYTLTDDEGKALTGVCLKFNPKLKANQAEIDALICGRSRLLLVEGLREEGRCPRFERAVKGPAVR